MYQDQIHIRIHIISKSITQLQHLLFFTIIDSKLAKIQHKRNLFYLSSTQDLKLIYTFLENLQNWKSEMYFGMYELKHLVELSIYQTDGITIYDVQAPVEIVTQETIQLIISYVLKQKYSFLNYHISRFLTA
jgi:hypothetical protein